MHFPHITARATIAAMTNIEELLGEDEPAILDEAAPAIARLAHYRRDGAGATRQRLEALYRHVVRAVRARDLDELLRHAAHVAAERAATGFELGEVDAAFSMLEAAIVRRALERLPQAELGWGLGLVGTALAHARSELERTFVSLAPVGRPGAVDLTAV